MITDLPTMLNRRAFLGTAGNGFGAAVSADQIRHLHRLTHGQCGIKAAGGIRELEQALDLIEAGATALGTGHGPALMKTLRQQR